MYKVVSFSPGHRSNFTAESNGLCRQVKAPVEHESFYTTDYERKRQKSRPHTCASPCKRTLRVWGFSGVQSRRSVQ